jgi:hypothetical protein
MVYDQVYSWRSELLIVLIFILLVLRTGCKCFVINSYYKDLILFYLFYYWYSSILSME